MAELTISTFLSLDGVMQAPGGPDEDTSGGFKHGGWTFPLADERFGKLILDIYSRADGFVLGRRTYDIFAGYWPQHNDPNDPIGSSLNTLPKFVASRSRTAFGWNNTAHLRDPVSELVALKDRFPRELQIPGSADLAQTLIRHDLIDEYRLFTFPVVLGSGKRLFADGVPPRTLKLVSTQTSPKGVMYSVYRRAGPLVTGAF